MDIIFNLESNNIILIDGIPCVDFKNCSKFSHKFNKTNNSFVIIANKTFIVDKDLNQDKYDILITESEKEVGIIHLPVDEYFSKTRDCQISIFNYDGQLIMFMEDVYATDFVVCKYDIDGNELNRKVFENTFLSLSEPETIKRHRYLYFKDIVGKDMVFTSLAFSTEKSKTIILSLDDFLIREFDKTANGLIANEDETCLAGFASNNEDCFDILLFDGQTFLFKLESAAPVCDFILQDNLLYIANFYASATGSSLYCFDICNNKIKWQADVRQLNIGHSRYYNNVILSKYKNKIIMEGNEAQGSYVQIFDANFGNKLADFGDFLN